MYAFQAKQFLFQYNVLERIAITQYHPPQCAMLKERRIVHVSFRDLTHSVLNLSLLSTQTHVALIVIGQQLSTLPSTLTHF